MSGVNADHVRAVVTRWFPHQEIALTRVVSGISTPVFRACVGEETFWVRTGEQSGEIRDGEVAVHRHLAAGHVPVPGILHYDATPAELDRAVALTTHIPGVPLSDLPPGEWTPELARETGRVLAWINRVPVRGFGWAYAASRDGLPVGEQPGRHGWVREYRDATRSVCGSGVLDEPTALALETAVECWADGPDREVGSLAHGDFDASHIYVDPERHMLTGIIDFGEIRGTDPLYDLGHLLLHDGEFGRPTLYPHILAGYTEVTPLPDDVMDRIRRQAVVIGVRALAIQVTRRPSRYRDWLVERTTSLL